jgi:hypothetical protein
LRDADYGGQVLDGSGRQVVNIVAINHDVFAQIAGLKAQLGGDRARRNQRLASRKKRPP